jgi:urease beta subunit
MERRVTALKIRKAEEIEGNPDRVQVEMCKDRIRRTLQQHFGDRPSQLGSNHNVGRINSALCVGIYLLRGSYGTDSRVPHGDTLKAVWRINAALQNHCPDATKNHWLAAYLVLRDELRADRRKWGF